MLCFSTGPSVKMTETAMSCVLPHLLQRAKVLYRTGDFGAVGGVASCMPSFSCMIGRILSVAWLVPSRLDFHKCCTKVIMSGVNGQVIMSGYRDDNPDDERREAARGNTKSVSRGADGGGGGDGDRNQRAAMLPDKSPGNQAWGEGSGSW